jgi:hypothetical protein
MLELVDSRNVGLVIDCTQLKLDEYVEELPVSVLISCNEIGPVAGKVMIK